MTKFLVKRLLLGLVVLVGVSAITFTFATLAPGDPLSAYYRPGTRGNPGDLEALRDRLGLDAPIHIRYFEWLRQIVTGNLGTTVQGVDVFGLLRTRLSATLWLTGSALILSIVVGVSLGMAAAFRRGSRFDNVLTGMVFLGISIPVYLVALVTIFALAVELKNRTGVTVFPTGGISNPDSSLPTVIDRAWHLVLPVVVLSWTLIAYFVRYTRSAVLEAMSRDHVRTARAKGVRESVVRRRHILRNASLPVITIIAVYLPTLVTGAVFVETIFRYPGVGLLTIEATRNREYNIIMAVSMLVASAIVVSSIVADVLYGVIDPRIRRSG